MNLEILAKEAFVVLKKISVLEESLLPYKEMLDGIKVKIEREMRIQGKKKIDSEEGGITWVDRRGNAKLDEKEIAKALGIENLNAFRTIRSKDTFFILFNVKKDDDKNKSAM